MPFQPKSFKLPSDVKQYILYFMVAVYPLIVVPNSLYNYFYAPRYAVLAFIAIFSLYVLIREKARVKHPAVYALSIFMIFLLISTLRAPHPLVAWVGVPLRYTGFTTYLFCAILFLIAFQVEEWQNLMTGMIFCAVLVSVTALFQHFGWNFVPHEPFREKYHSFGTMGNPNFLGTYTAFILTAAMLFYLRNGKNIWLIASAVIYAGMLTSLTRGTWLASFATFVILARYILRLPEKRKIFIKLVVVLLLVTCLLAPTENAIILQHIFSIPGEMESAVHLEEKAGSNRMLIWRETVKLIPRYWAFGMGPDHLRYAGIETLPGTVADKAHNVYLEIAVTMGIFALVAYLIFLSFFLRPWKDYKGFIFFMIIFTYLIQGFFNIDVVMVMPLFWIVLGLYLQFQGRYSINRNAGIQ